MENNTIKTYKGFDKDMTCRGFQYEVGKEYEHQGEVKACESGFHACENPFDVLGFYPPCDGKGNLRRYCEVEQRGVLDRSENDKVCSSRLHIIAEIGLNGLINAGVRFILDKVNWKDAKESNTGNCSAATNTGNYSAAMVEGKESIAIVTGKESKAKGALGCWLMLTERDENWHILGVKAVKVDGEAVKPNRWYKLKNGEITECND